MQGLQWCVIGPTWKAESGYSRAIFADTISKDFFRLGSEVDFRGNKAFHWRHWGCADDKLVGKIKASYGAASEIDGYAGLQAAEQEKVKRAWEEGAIPSEDKGPGEAADVPKKAPQKRKKAEEDGDEEKPKRPRAKKAKVGITGA